MGNYENAIEILKKYNQDKILNTLINNKNEELVNQILSIDFEQIECLKSEIGKEKIYTDDKIENISYVDSNKMDNEEKIHYEKIGNKIISEGKYAVVTMAGGQGTRLGHEGPKGTYVLDIKPEKKSLFEILSETLKRENNKYNTIINWYIMTSRENNDETVEYFKENNYFSYPEENIKFFIQGEMPLIDTEGKLLLDSEEKIQFASDGNGSIYHSMAQKGILDDMKQKNIEWVYICSVDNILLKMVEPLLVGLTKESGNEIASKTIVKKNPQEKVGVFCLKNGKPYVIEYTELPEEMAELVDENNELVFGESHIMCNLFSLNAIEKISKVKLPYHIAFKKIKHYENGEIIEPSSPNAYKFEAFIFDSFSMFDNITLLRGKREEDFAPVKNKEGNDSPETAIKMYNEFWNK